MCGQEAGGPVPAPTLSLWKMVWTPSLAGWAIVDPPSWPLAFGRTCEGCTDCVHRPGPAGAQGGLTAGLALPVLPQPCRTHPSSSPGQQDVPSAHTPTPSKRLLECITSSLPSLAGKGGLRESAQCCPEPGPTRHPAGSSQQRGVGDFWWWLVITTWLLPARRERAEACLHLARLEEPVPGSKAG